MGFPIKTVFFLHFKINRKEILAFSVFGYGILVIFLTNIEIYGKFMFENPIKCYKHRCKTFQQLPLTDRFRLVGRTRAPTYMQPKTFVSHSCQTVSLSLALHSNRKTHVHFIQNCNFHFDSMLVHLCFGVAL